MPGEPNYLRRLVLILCCFMIGFTLIIVDGWTLIYDPYDDGSWILWILHRLPLVVGAVVLITGFVLLRQPVANDPTQGPDDLDNMDGA